MDVAVGSGNPVKLAAVRDALPTASVESTPVDSGVPEQPHGIAETLRGAETRAERALPGHDLGVGLEGGVARYGPAEGLWLVMWAAATDGDRWGRGGGPSIRLPDGIARQVEAGAELGPVMDDVLDEEGVARDRGAAGALTGGVTTRRAALGTAVAGALGPFLTPHY